MLTKSQLCHVETDPSRSVSNFNNNVHQYYIVLTRACRPKLTRVLNYIIRKHLLR